MAVNEIAFQVNLKKDTNSASRTYGMYFGEPETKKPLSLKGQHSEAHRSGYTVIGESLTWLYGCRVRQ